jgi:CMP-2-keto-3-deoxyoctulosonic acid synthetase
MFQKIAIGLMFVVALSALVSGTVVAADKTHDGTVVSAAEGKLVMTDKEGKNEHTHMVAAAIKVTLDGKDAKLIDLKKGDAVKVTVDPEGNVVAIAATRANG